MPKIKPYSDDEGEVRELDVAFFAGARRGRPPLPDAQKKRRVNIMLDPDVLAHFRASGRGWQTRINAILRTHAGLE